MRQLVKLYGRAIFQEVARRPLTAATLAPAAVLADSNYLYVTFDRRGNDLMYLCTLAFSSTESNFHRLLELLELRDTRHLSSINSHAADFARNDLPGCIRQLINYSVARYAYTLDLTLKVLTLEGLELASRRTFSRSRTSRSMFSKPWPTGRRSPRFDWSWCALRTRCSRGQPRPWY